MRIDTGWLQSPAPRLERRMEPQAPPGIFHCARLPAKSDFHSSSRGCASRGVTPPRVWVARKSVTHSARRSTEPSRVVRAGESAGPPPAVAGWPGPVPIGARANRLEMLCLAGNTGRALRFEDRIGPQIERRHGTY